MEDLFLKDKVLLVTGANHGIGANIALESAKAGAKVFLTYFCPEKDIKQPSHNEPGEELYRYSQAQSASVVVKEIKDTGGTAHSLELDLGIPANIQLLFNTIEEKIGTVDIIVNNAAYCKNDTFIAPTETDFLGPDYLGKTEVSADSILKHFSINTFAPVLIMLEYYKRYMKAGKKWGRIINISSDGASNFPGEISYGASKFALESYSRSAASELGKFGITTNILSLGAVQTGWINRELENELSHSYPVGRVGNPIDVSNMVLFLCSHKSDWTTGQLIYVGGGNKMQG